MNENEERIERLQKTIAIFENWMQMEHISPQLRDVCLNCIKNQQTAIGKLKNK
jgi:hypothetical protein